MFFFGCHGVINKKMENIAFLDHVYQGHLVSLITQQHRLQIVKTGWNF